MAKNIAPSIVGSYFKGLREDSDTNVATGDLNVRNGPDLFTPVEQVGSFGTFSMNAAGQWTYELDNSLEATQALDQGQRLSDWFYASTADGLATHIVYVTVHGAREGRAGGSNDSVSVQLVGVNHGHEVDVA